mgnify:CR=1 FL=1
MIAFVSALPLETKGIRYMTLKLYFHPAVVVLPEGAHRASTKTTRRSRPVIVDLFNEASATAFKKIWPIGKFPVLP